VRGLARTRAGTTCDAPTGSNHPTFVLICICVNSIHHFSDKLSVGWLVGWLVVPQCRAPRRGPSSSPLMLRARSGASTSTSSASRAFVRVARVRQRVTVVQNAASRGRREERSSDFEGVGAGRPQPSGGSQPTNVNSSSYVVPDPRRVQERHGKRLYHHGHGDMLLREDLIESLMTVDPAKQVRRAGEVVLTKEQKKILDAFWIGVGVKKKTHRERLIAHAAKAGLYRDPVRLLERLASLEDALWLGASISGADLGTIVGRCPRVIYCDLDFTAEKVELLRELLPTVDLKRLVERNPQILSMDMTHTMPAKIRGLSRLLPHTDVFALIEANPKILSMNISNSVTGNLNVMRLALAAEGVGESTIEAMIMYSPRILATNPTTFTTRLRQLAQTSPGAIQQYALKPASLARLVTSSEAVLSRIAFLAERHPEENISAIVAVNTSSKTFLERFPDFDEWARDR